MGKITTVYKGDMLFESQCGKHIITIDVPGGMGGSDRGPTPPDVFIASLGSCVAAFVANYCNQTGIDATDLSVDVLFDKADDPTRLTNIAVNILLPNATCKHRRKALKRVAEHCPVHETIGTMEDVDMKILDKADLAAAS